MLNIKIFWVLLLFSFISANTYCQNFALTGNVSNKNGQSINNVAVLLKNQKNQIISFANTTNNGNFSLSFSNTTKIEELFIEINYLGFKKVHQILTPNTLQYNFILEEKPIELLEVKVKNKPIINLKGDTLSYKVNSFSQAQDRSIGDVLKRMPGIEIKDNGQIAYNGKNISNMYIGGDDLLDGKYALGTRTIPKDVIESVDVMQNHQPIKVLKGKSFTDDVALNLVIKDNANLTISTEAMLAVGLPKQYDLAFNTMLFNKKFKMLNVLQANNIGTDYMLDLQTLGNSNFMLYSNDNPSSLLSVGAVGTPNIPHKNYYLNNSGMLNANNLYNFKNGLQIKSNIQFFLDRNRFNYNNNTSYYLSNDTVSFNEAQNIIAKPFKINATFKLMMNKEAYFIGDDLKINYSNELNNASIFLNNIGFNQQLANKIQDISNDFRFTPMLKSKQIVDLSWRISYYSNAQQLDIDKGLNKEILNENISFIGIKQTAVIPAWLSNASASYRIVTHKIKQNYRLELLNEYKQLKSALNLLQNNYIETAYLTDNGNALHWYRNKVAFYAFYEWKKNNWEVLLNTPLIAQQIKYNDANYNLNEKLNDVFINPSIRVKYFTSSEDYLQFNYNRNSTMGNVNNVYRGVILTNYRTLQANDADIQYQIVEGANIFYNFQQSLSMLFINGGVNYNKSKYNAIASTKLNNNVEQTILLPYNNQITTLNFKFGISKYIFFLNTTASFKFLWSKNNFNQLFNNVILPVTNTGITFNANLEAKLFRKINASYNGTLFSNKTWSKKSTVDFKQKVSNFNQKISLTYSPIKNMFTSVSGRNISSNQENRKPINYLFVDANVKYKMIKWKTDLEITLDNLTNVKKYEAFDLLNNRFSYSAYNIRGQMAIFKASFYF